MKLFYIYRIQSTKNPSRIYTGYSEDINSRLKSHNAGKNKHTSDFRPWRLVNLFAFTDMDKAKKFENYLKSGSGRAFSKRHF